MKALIIVLLLSLSACGHESSPEGRSLIRTEKLQKQIDSLKNQNNAILDTMKQIDIELKKLNAKIN